MGAPVLRALLAGQMEAAEGLLGARLPESWDDMTAVFRVRLQQLEDAPRDEPWLTRAVVLEHESRVIGVTGFHGRPGGAWLQDHAPEGVEFGYTIFDGYRRRGYAAEAGEALISWANREHDIRTFVLSIEPGNHASIAVATKLGFRKAGEWVHPERGREFVYLRTVELPPSAAV